MYNPVKNGFNGDVEGLTLVDIVQLACLEGSARKLIVHDENKNGTIFFSKSEIIHAEFEQLCGEEAFYHIMSWPSGTISLTFADTNVQTIDTSWKFLLMEAARRIDEQDDSHAKESDLLKILVVDDSRLFTKAFVKLFDEEIGAKVVGTSNNGKEALKFLDVQVPELVTLDINMPVMGGDVALKHIMILSPAPVVLVSNFNEQSCSKLMDFMRLGAVDVVAKPINPQSWKIVSKRLQYILTYVKEIQVNNVSRAKTLLPVAGKSTPEKAATKMVLILGGLGGMLELQKIIPSLEYKNDTAVMVIQNMYPTITEHLASYLDNFILYSTTTLSPGTEVLGGQCLVADCQGKWDILSEHGIPIISGSPDENNENALDANRVLISASEIFGAAVTAVILSGADMDIKKGLEYAADNGSMIVFQSPESCLLPGPISALQNLDLESHCLKPEEIASFLSKNL